MTIQHRSHHERVAAGVGFEWDRLPPIVEHLSEISAASTQLRLRRNGKSYRGIGDLQDLTHLWAYAVDQKFFEEICGLSSLEMLYVERVTATDLFSVARLTSLTRLSVVGATKVPDLTWAAPLTSLHSLALENLKLVRDLEPLSGLTRLEALGVEGSMWTPMRIGTLQPLERLVNLQCVFLTNLRVADGSLVPLHELAHLRVLQCAKFFSAGEFERLAEARPELRCTWFERDARLRG